MWSQHFRQFATSPLLVYPVLSLLVFAAFFGVVLVFVLKTGKSLEGRASLALKDDDHE